MSAKKSSLNLKQADLLMGCVLLGLSILFYILTFNFGGYEMEKVPHDPGPTFMPRLLLAALGVEAVFLIITGSARRLEGDETPAKLNAVFQTRPLVMLAAFLVYIYLTFFFGYIIATMAFMLLAFFLLKVRGIWSLLLIPPAITAATYFLFGTVLNIYLPTGEIF
jgi:hypothetical protein